MNSTTTARFVPSGSLLAAELFRLLRDLGYNLAGIDDVTEHVNQFGTARDSAADLVDVQAINALVARHTAGVEYESAADWPSLYDEDVWNLTPVEPPVGPLPSETFYAADYEPSAADRAYWAQTHDAEQRLDRAVDRLAEEAAALDLLMKGLDAYPAPICGGAPSPDERPVRPWDDQTGTRSRPVRGWTDADQYRAHGCI